MNKIRMIGLSLMVAGFAASGYAAVTNNLLADASFEGLVGNEPNTNSTPWFTFGEGGNGSFISSTAQAHSGTNSVQYAFYYDGGAVVQNTGTQIEAGKDYEASMWMLINEPSTNSAHTNASIVSMSLYTSPTVDGTYTYRKGFFGNVPSTTNEWQEFKGVWIANDLKAWTNLYAQIRFAKSNDNTEHKIALDDVAFGEFVYIPEPTPSNLLVGWDTTNGDPDYQAGGVTGTLFTGKAFAVNATAGSTDGTFGSTNAGATILNSAYEVRTASTTTKTNNIVGVQIHNTTGAPLQLDSISFDYGRWFANGPQDVILTYAYGDLNVTTQSVIYTATGASITGKSGNYDDFDISLTNLSDRVLSDGEKATFNLIATNAIGVSSSGAFDNIAIFGGEGPAEPLTGYAAYSNDYSLVYGPYGDDDEDGLLNIYEYGLGGDPTNDLVQGTAPTFGVVNMGGTNWFGYIHPQLKDPQSGITYKLALTTDLMNVGWATNSGYFVLGTNVPVSGDLNYVTNVTDTTATKKFIKLIIE